MTILSENLELFENTTIKNKKVVLDTAKIQTNEYELKIIAEKFISNHSIIQNFPEKQTAEKNNNGKFGGNILIEAKTASGSLKLVLNGENAGAVPKRRDISREERIRLSGLNGRHGRNAVYREFCNESTIFIFSDTYCWEECVVNPTRGENGRDARQGLPGFNGKNGGNSGSFHLKAQNFLNFHFTEIKKTPGLGSKGGKGSFGGVGGRKGINGRDYKNLCKFKPKSPRNGRDGKIGQRGKDGESGREQKVCLEKISLEETKKSIKYRRRNFR